MKYLQGLTLTLMFMLAGCTLVGPEDETTHLSAKLEIRTDKAVYTTPEDRLVFTVSVANHTGRPVYLNHSGQRPNYAIEKQVDSTWVHAYAPAITLDLKPPLALKSGEVLSHSFSMDRTLHAWNLNEDLPGTYRVIFFIQKTEGNVDNLYHGEPLPLTDRTSTPFEIRR